MAYRFLFVNLAMFCLFLRSTSQSVSSKQFPSDSFIVKMEIQDLNENWTDVNRSIKKLRSDYLNNSELVNTTYDIACLFALNNQLDSAFKYLNIYVATDKNLRVLVEPMFIYLFSDPRWRLVEKSLLSAQSKKINTSLLKKLLRLQAYDQAYYNELDLIETYIGNNSSPAKILWLLKQKISEDNLKRLELLVKKSGWPKSSTVGVDGVKSAFLVIQHADIKTQLKYLPIIRNNCLKNEEQWEDYALLFDRTEVAQGKPQKYGTQVKLNNETGKYELYPLLDSKQVDAWRKEFDLLPLALYLKTWNIILNKE